MGSHDDPTADGPRRTTERPRVSRPLLTDPAILKRNKATSPVFDAQRFCRGLEAAYEIMWRRHRRCKPPASFAAAPQR